MKWRLSGAVCRIVPSASGAVLLDHARARRGTRSRRRAARRRRGADRPSRSRGSGTCRCGCRGRGPAASGRRCRSRRGPSRRGSTAARAPGPCARPIRNGSGWSGVRWSEPSSPTWLSSTHVPSAPAAAASLGHPVPQLRRLRRAELPRVVPRREYRYRCSLRAHASSPGRERAIPGPAGRRLVHKHLWRRRPSACLDSGRRKGAGHGATWTRGSYSLRDRRRSPMSSCPACDTPTDDGSTLLSRLRHRPGAARQPHGHGAGALADPVALADARAPPSAKRAGAGGTASFRARSSPSATGSWGCSAAAAWARSTARTT